MLVMDLVMVGEFAMMGLPVDTQLVLIGSIFGGGVALGVVLHIVMGALLGLVFSVAVLTVEPLRIHSVGRGVGLGVLAGVVTIPFGCVPFAIVAGVPILEMVSFSTVPHLVWGVLLGIVAGYGLRSRT
jgi:ethanolamine transporter EutH